jgi:hypothetical protein
MSLYSEITENYLDKIYDDCLKEETRLLNSLRKNIDMDINEKDIQRQAALLHTIANASLKLNLLRKKAAMKF